MSGRLGPVAPPRWVGTCPKCHALDGQPCRNLRTALYEPRKAPHKER